MPKMKTRSAAKKRFVITASGKVKTNQGKRKRSGEKIRSVIVSEASAVAVRGLFPYAKFKKHK